ncbi:MAG: hypothetical protein WC091_19645 [Sulfuricellaceae bacterium]
MTKIAHNQPSQGPIAQKVLSGFRKTQGKKVVDLLQFKEAQLNAERLDKTVISKKQMADYDPVHAIYISGQNRMSVFAEQLSDLPHLSKLANSLADAQDEYQPSYPPMSPITNSYFSCWDLFDLTTGIKKETFGTITIELCRVMGVDAHTLTVFQLLQDSRMGFYVHEGVTGKLIALREIMTGKRTMAFSGSGYMGERGQIWYTRVVPEPFPELGYGYGVVFTTPYVMLEMSENGGIHYTTEKKWVDFFERNLPKTNIKDPIAAYNSLMKYGLSRQQMHYPRPGMHYWNEFIFEGYVNHQSDMILLAGYPDIASSRPHSGLR